MPRLRVIPGVLIQDVEVNIDELVRNGEVYFDSGNFTYAIQAGSNLYMFSGDEYGSVIKNASKRARVKITEVDSIYWPEIV